MAYQLKLNNVQPRVHFFNTFFYLKLYKQHSAYNFKAVSRTLNGLGYDAARCDKLMVPIHHRRVMHWTCAEIDRRAATITHFDSLGEGAVTSSSTLILQNLKRYMQDLDKQNGLPSSAWSLVVAQDTPQQRNLCDCGVFALMTCKWRALDLPFSYDQRDADYFRRRIMSDIIDLAGPAQVSTAKRALFETPPPADAARNVRARR
jgi:sentrin-specific protease 1